MNHPTNSSVDLSADEAIDLTGRIREKVGEVWPLIVEAFERRAWIALGLPSWADYCTAHLRGMVPALDRGERQSKVAELRDAGFSTRAIGSALGVADQTVRADLALVRDFTQQPAAVVGVDGKAYAPTRPAPASGEALFPPLTAVQAESVEQHVAWRDNLAERANASSAPFALPRVEDLPAGLDPAAVEKYAEATQREQSARYMHEFMKVLSRSDDFLRFDPERIGQLASEDDVRAVRDLADSMKAFSDQLVKARMGLRVLVGGLG